MHWYLWAFGSLVLAAALTLAEKATLAYPLEENDDDEDDKPSEKRIETLQGQRETLATTTTIAWATALALSVALVLRGYVVDAASSANPTWAFLAIAATSTLLFILFGSLVPGAAGARYAKSLAPFLSLPLGWFFVTSRAFTAAMYAIANFILDPLRRNPPVLSPYASEDRIRAVIDEGLKSGAIDEAEHEILENVFEFNDLKAGEVMTPRTEMIAVELTEDDRAVFDEIVATGHSLVPVYRETIDKIIGVVHIKDILRVSARRELPPIKSVVRPAYFVPETKLISEILREMRKRGERISIVTDEYGGTEGLVTLEDILSEIVGEISAEGEPPSVEYVRLPDGAYSILGSMHIDDFNDVFDVELPTSEKYNTVAGFVSFNTGKILNPGELYERDGIVFELLKKLKQRMVRFKISAPDRSLTILDDAENNEQNT